jgi:hypothetical protein
MYTTTIENMYVAHPCILGGAYRINNFSHNFSCFCGDEPNGKGSLLLGGRGGGRESPTRKGSEEKNVQFEIFIKNCGTNVDNFCSARVLIGMGEEHHVNYTGARRAHFRMFGSRAANGSLNLYVTFQ